MQRLSKLAWSLSTLLFVSLVNAADTRINSGGAATGVWIADAYFNTGNTYNTNATIDTSGVVNPAPTAVYQNVRWASAFTYTIPGFVAGGSYSVRLHVCELTWTAANQRKFNVAINGASVLSNYDVFAATGARYKAIAPQFNTTANGSGQIIIAFTQGSPVIDNPMISGIEILATTPNLALNKPVTVSSIQDATYPGSNAVDGNTATRWSSAFSDPQWIYVDLQATYNITQVKLNWETAYGSSYQIQTSPDATIWTTIFSTTTGNGAIDDLTGLSGSGRYVRMYGTVRGTVYGYSLWEFEVYGTASSGPEINVTGNAVSIPDGDTTPSTSDHTDFGSVAVASGTVTRTFTVQNTGNAALSVSTVTVSGTHAADFTVTLQPATSVAAGGSTTFQVTLDPSASGLRSASLNFGNGDVDENPYNFSIQGTGTVPEINVTGNAVTITDGDTTPSTSDHTDFGSIDVTSGTVTRTFTVQNTGGAALSVGSVTISGTHAADFTVTVQPATSMAAGGNTTFQVRFDPSASGLRSASLSFANGDADENPYNYSIQGTGTTTGTPVVQINSGGSATGSWIADTYFNQGNTFSDASAIDTSGVVNPAPTVVYQNVRWFASFTYTIPGLTAGAAYQVRLHFCELTWTAANQRKFNVAINGATVLSNYDVFAATGARYKAIVPQFNTTANGSGQIVIAFTQGSPVIDNPMISGIEVLTSAPQPEINVTGNAVTIPDGDTAPSTSDHTDFGGVAVTGGTLTRTFTIQNTGSTALSVSSVTISGTHAADFTVTVQPATSVAAGGSTTFQVRFDPSASGVRSASLSFGNGDTDENPYNFSIQGTGTTGFWPSGGSANNNLESASDQWASWRARPVDMVLAYTTRDAGWANLISTTCCQLGAYQNHSRTMIIQQAPFPTGIGANWSALVSGAYDSFWQQFGSNLAAREAAGFVPAIVSVAWEANGTYFYWGGCGSGEKYSSPAQYIAGFQRIVTQMKVTHPTVKVAWIMNGHGTPGCIGPDSSVLYPGDAYVDYIGVDYYDHFPSAATQAEFDSEGNAPDGIWWFLQMARNHGKQLLVPEWGIAPGSVGGNTTGDNPDFITWMFGVFQNAHGTGNMGGETYFDDPCGGGNVDSDLINGCNPLSAARYLQLY
jgi:hypothetical protein